MDREENKGTGGRGDDRQKVGGMEVSMGSVSCRCSGLIDSPSLRCHDVEEREREQERERGRERGHKRELLF